MCKFLSVFGLLLACLVPQHGLAQSSEVEPASQRLIVGVKVAPPFVIAESNAYAGLAIDLWEEAAVQNNWAFEYRQFELEELLEAVSRGDVDVGIGAITATAEREADMDFAHAIISSGLGVAVRSNHRSGWLAAVGALFSPAFLKIIGVLVLLLFSVGVLVWLLERKGNPEHFGGGSGNGIFSGFWWAIVTMTTVGYGDLAPRTIGGRLLGMIWMVTALLVVSFFTASITSALTVGQLSQRISNADDLAGAVIASVADTTSAEWLERRGLEFSTAADVDSALRELADGQVDAVLYDAPLLRWEINRKFRGMLHILPLVLERQDYAFALPDSSPLREELDASILHAINASDWHVRVSEYLGEHK
ncbi:transporter substrate-binding domain-containing protein [Dokdonella sp.]|uniref:transporter substrate-binding domain-containing protein n=1 Tax=Dokdonella sp. TaxID=2291710 RepID=UPI003C4183B9